MYKTLFHFASQPLITLTNTCLIVQSHQSQHINLPSLYLTSTKHLSQNYEPIL